MGATLLQSNFTAGELSPRLIGRTDIANYANAAEILENVDVKIHGGATRRAGTRYRATAKISAKRTRLIPFVFSTTQAYILELGDSYVRFYTTAGVIGAPYEIASPYIESELFDVDYVQSADTMFLCHPAHPPQRIRRFADQNWTFDAVPFDVMPFDQIGDSFNTGLTLSTAAIGAGATVTAGAALFQTGDVGRNIVYQGGAATITAFTDSTHVTASITATFPGTVIPANLWTLGGSPQDTLTPSAKDPIGATITLTASALNCFRTTDVGKWVRINGGLARVTVFTSALIVQARVVEVLDATAAAPAGAWTLEAAVWSALNGWPRCVTLFQQRLIYAGTTAFPQTFWGSSTGAYLDFTIGSFDDDGFAFTIASDQINPILHLVPTKVLNALTYGGEFTINGGVEKPITATNVQVDSQTTYGADAVRPVRVGKNILFAQRAGLKIRAMTYSPYTGEYDAPDVTVFAEHITGTGLADLTFKQEPDPIVYAPRADGVLAAMAVSAPQDVQAWTRYTSGAAGVFESVATIPNSLGDETWALVKRTVGGVTVRYIETLDPTMFYSLDAAITGTSGPGLAVWPGLAHLNGQTVACVADGSYMGTFVVAGGAITLPRAAFAVVIGLPFTHTVKMLTPSFQGQTGTSDGGSMRISECTARFRNTYACDLTSNTGAQPIPFQEFGGDLLDQSPIAFTGIKQISVLGWERGLFPITFSSDRPFPFELQSVIRRFESNQ